MSRYLAIGMILVCLALVVVSEIKLAGLAPKSPFTARACSPNSG